MFFCAFQEKTYRAQQRGSPYFSATNIGVISYNETQLKALLGITVISTDYKGIGETATNLTLSNKNALIIGIGSRGGSSCESDTKQQKRNLQESN